MQIAWHGYPAQSPLISVTFYNVIVFQNLLPLLLILFWLGTKKSNTNLNNIFYTSFRFDNVLSEIVLQKGELNLIMSA